MLLARLSGKAVIGLSVAWVIVVSLATMLATLARARRAASSYRAQHSTGDYLVAVSSPIAGWWLAVLVVIPLLFLIVGWIVSRPRAP